MTKPTIHRNGTAATDLLEDTLASRTAINNALKVLRDHGPNGRDYYPQGPDAFQGAVREHEMRIAKLVEVLDELTEMADYVADFC